MAMNLFLNFFAITIFLPNAFDDVAKTFRSTFADPKNGTENLKPLYKDLIDLAAFSKVFFSRQKIVTVSCQMSLCLW